MVPAALAGAVEIGSIVRRAAARPQGARLGGRKRGRAGRLRAAGDHRRRVARSVCRARRARAFGAWRYAGRLRPFLLAGSPRRVVRVLPPAPPAGAAAARSGAGELRDRRGDAPGARDAVVAAPPPARGPPARRRHGGARLAPVRRTLSSSCRPRQATPKCSPGGSLRSTGTSRAAARGVGRAAAGGCTVCRARASAFAPVGRLGLVVVLDAHSEAYVEQRAPTWDARPSSPPSGRAAPECRACR